MRQFNYDILYEQNNDKKLFPNHHYIKKKLKHFHEIMHSIFLYDFYAVMLDCQIHHDCILFLSNESIFFYFCYD